MNLEDDETQEILADPELVKAIKEADAKNTVDLYTARKALRLPPRYFMVVEKVRKPGYPRIRKEDQE